MNSFQILDASINLRYTGFIRSPHVRKAGVFYESELYKGFAFSYGRKIHEYEQSGQRTVHHPARSQFFHLSAGKGTGPRSVLPGQKQTGPQQGGRDPAAAF